MKTLEQAKKQYLDNLGSGRFKSIKESFKDAYSGLSSGELQKAIDEYNVGKQQLGGKESPISSEVARGLEELYAENALRDKSEKDAQDAKEAENKRMIDMMVQGETAKRQEAQLQKTLDDIFGKVESAGIERISDQFIPARQKAIAEEAALGRLTSPVSIVPLSNIDKQKQLAMSQLFGNIASQKAAGQLDVSKTIEGILAAERDAELRNKQFEKELGFRNQSLIEQINQQNQDRLVRKQIADQDYQLGKYKMDNSGGRDILDYLNVGFSGLSALGGAAGGAAKLGEIYGKGKTSDIRVKKNINKLGEIKGINIYSFEYNKPELPSGTHIGVMAQEIEPIIPEAVSELNGIKQVDYDIVSNYLVGGR